MPGRIVLFGATGFTGRLIARALVRRGLAPVLAGRRAEALRALAEELGGLETRVAEVERPDSVCALVERGDVLLSAVGPFGQLGRPALEAAIGAGVSYLDCCGEPRFVREVFERHGTRAATAGCALLTGFGYDWLPGNLAGALALEEAGSEAIRIDIGYFAPGVERLPVAPGTRATLAAIMADPAFAWEDGQLVTVASTRRRRAFETAAGEAEALSVGAAEHFTLPRLFPALRDVDVYVGWMGWASRPAQAMVLATSMAAGLPGVRSGMLTLAGLLARAPGSGPDAEGMARTSSEIVAEARDRAGAVLTRVRLAGAGPYELTAGMLAWGAEAVLAGGLRAAGAPGPIEAFGLQALQTALAQSGIHRV
jgi:short subunit dehydrogenase-like uncharacterized protein